MLAQKKEWVVRRRTTHSRGLIWRGPVSYQPSRHPEGPLYFAVRFAACDSDIAQGRVTEVFQLVAAPRPPVPLSDAEFDLVQTPKTMSPEDGHCRGAHG